MRERRRTFEITISAETDNVAVVRHAIAGLAESIGMEPRVVGDLKTVITEACMNSVVHAYPDGEGTVVISAEPDDGSMLLTVTDTGSGFRPSAGTAIDDSDPSLRLGLALIASLTTEFSISGGLERGTEVKMRLPLKPGGSDGLSPTGKTERNSARERAVRIIASEPQLLEPVLSRTMSAYGIRNDLSIDRVSDAMILADAIAAAAPSSFGDTDVNIELSDHDGGLNVAIGPLAPGGEQVLRDGLKVPGLDATIETVADQVNRKPSDEGGYLVFRFSGDA